MVPTLKRSYPFSVLESKSSVSEFLSFICSLGVDLCDVLWRFFDFFFFTRNFRESLFLSLIGVFLLLIWKVSFFFRSFWHLLRHDFFSIQSDLNIRVHFVISYFIPFYFCERLFVVPEWRFSTRYCIRRFPT